MIKGILFDFDGTLLDSMSAWTQVGDALLMRYGIQANEDLDQRFQTFTLRQAAEYLHRQYLLDQSIDFILQELQEIVKQRYQHDLPLKPGVTACLDRLVKEDVQLAVVTASQKAITLEALQRCGILSYFQHIVTCEELGMNKTQPAIFLHAQRLLGLAQEEVLVVDDALHALQAAKKAGFTCWAMYDESQQQDWAQITQLSDQAFSSMKELEECLCLK